MLQLVGSNKIHFIQGFQKVVKNFLSNQNYKLVKKEISIAQFYCKMSQILEPFCTKLKKSHQK